MTADVVQIADFRKAVPDVPESDQPMNDEDKLKFAMDTVADEWANDLVHHLMIDFAERGTDIDFTDPVFGKLMVAVQDVVLSMTRHHLNVVDETALMLQQYPDAEVSVGIITLNEEDDST